MTSKVMVAPQFEDSKSEQYRYIFATGVFGGLDPNGGHIIFYLDRVEPETINTPQPGAIKLMKIIRELQVEVHMTSSEFKTVAEWMKRHVDEYEKIFGSIPQQPLKKGKKKKTPTQMYA